MRSRLLSPGDPGTSADLRDDERELVLNWRLVENRSMEGGFVFARIAHHAADQSARGYSSDHYGTFRALPPGQPDGATHEAEVRRRVTRYIRSGDYGPGHITMRDRARNTSSTSFAVGHATHEAPPLIRVTNPTEDLVPPVLNIDACTTGDTDEHCLRITARPLNPESPDGRTLVRLSYWAWEDQPIERASGFSYATLRLRDPQGQEYFHYHGDGQHAPRDFSPILHARYHGFPAGIRERFPDADRTTPVQYILDLILPRGSAPGTWGLTEMVLYDYAGNSRIYQFTEVIRFDVEGGD